MNKSRADALEEVLASVHAYFRAKDTWEKIDIYKRSAKIPAGLHLGQLEKHLREVLEAALSSSREAAAPPPTPKGLERWQIILNEELATSYTCLTEETYDRIISAIRRSVEEALVAAASPLEDATQRNARVQARYDELMRIGKHGHYETMFRVVREELERAASQANGVSGS